MEDEFKNLDNIRLRGKFYDENEFPEEDELVMVCLDGNVGQMHKLRRERFVRRVTRVRRQEGHDPDERI